MTFSTLLFVFSCCSMTSIWIKGGLFNVLYSEVYSVYKIQFLVMIKILILRDNEISHTLSVLDRLLTKMTTAETEK